MSTDESAAWVRPRVDRAGIRRDAALAALLALAAITTSLLYLRTGLYAGQTPDLWVWVLGLGLCTLPLAFRRVWPIPVALLVSLGFFVCGQFGVPEVLIINICLFIALYSVGAWESRRDRAVWARLGIGIGIGMILWLVLWLIISSSDADSYPGLSRAGLFSAYATFSVIQIITNLLYFGGAAFFGERSWRAAREHALLEAQGHELELERRTSAAQAVALDRLGIARELHDAVAHHVSVMGIQASAARRTLERAPHDTDRAITALKNVEASARGAVEELRRLVGTLRSPGTEHGSSTIGLAQLPTLIAESRTAGTPTTLIVAGTHRPLPMLIDVALYRVVQEALTNIRKHAGPGATADVRLRFSAREVEAEISDTGVRQRAHQQDHGTGLIGMRERIGAVGGTVSAGRRERGGFLVRATVPLPDAAPSEGATA